MLRDPDLIQDRDIYFLCAASAVPWDVSTSPASNCSVPCTVKLCSQRTTCRVLLGPMRTLLVGQSTLWVSVRLQSSLQSVYVNVADPRAAPAARCVPQRWCAFRPKCIHGLEQRKNVCKHKIELKNETMISFASVCGSNLKVNE